MHKRTEPISSMESKLITHLAPKDPASEAYRSLRTNIQFASPDDPLHTLLVTSPGVGEGKTLTAVNLAITLAQAGRKVLIVDSDLRRSTLHKLFSLDRVPGLCDILAKESDVKEVIGETRVPNLHIMSSGPSPPNPSELLGSKKMKTLIERLKKEFDNIIFDSPPVIPVTDASVLAGYLDGVLMIIRMNLTHREALIRAKAMLDNVRARVIGIVVNDLHLERGYGYYHHYYSYSEERGKGHPRAKRAEER